jgi:hypothetical protein
MHTDRSPAPEDGTGDASSATTPSSTTSRGGVGSPPSMSAYMPSLRAVPLELTVNAPTMSAKVATVSVNGPMTLSKDQGGTA